MNNLTKQILAALQSNGPQTTRQLSKIVGVDSQQVHRVCRDLEEGGKLISATRKQLFFPMTREIVTGDNYERIQRLDDELREVIEEHELPKGRAGLVTALEDHFTLLRRRVVLEEYVAAISDFEKEFLKVARRAVEHSDLYLRLGIKRLGRIWGLPGHKSRMPGS